MSVKAIGLVNAPVSRAIFPYGNLTAISAFGNGTMSIQYIAPDWPVTASRVDALVSWSIATAATTATAAIAMTAYACVYTANGTTLGSASSGSTQTTYTYASNSAGNTQLSLAGIRPVSVPMNMNMTPGEYYVGFGISTNASSVGLSTTNLGQTISMMGGNQIETVAPYAEFTATTGASTNLVFGMGLYTAATAAPPATIGSSDVAMTGANLSKANIALVFRNY